MNILVILPTPAAGSEAVRFWRQRLTPDDRLYLLSIVGGKQTAVAGVDLYYLEIDGEKGRQWRSRLIRGIGWRLVSHGVGLWRAYLSDIWPEFIWNIQSWDPDIVDLRWLQGKSEFERKLRKWPWRVIGSEADVPSQLTDGAGWRRYDPEQKISIVLPVYNGAAYLKQSIESCLEQTHRNIELVIVDDCSKDNSPAIIAGYAARDPRIVSIRNPVNKRLPQALNIGFAATTGRLLTWTSHDNYYAPTAIESLARYLDTWQDVDLVYSAYQPIDEMRQTQPAVAYYPLPPWWLPFRNVVGPYFLFRRRVYEEVGDHRDDMEYAEDYDFWVRAYKNGHRFMRRRDVLYSYRLHSDSMTAEAEKMGNKPHVGDKVRREHFQFGS